MSMRRAPCPKCGRLIADSPYQLALHLNACTGEPISKWQRYTLRKKAHEQKRP